MKMQELSLSLERKLKLLDIEECNNPRTPKYIAYKSKESQGLQWGEKGPEINSRI